MTRYFHIAVVSTAAIFAAASGSAFAWSTVQRSGRLVSNDSSTWVGETGTASFYGPAYHGRRTAGGTRFDQMALTAAHRWLPFGTRVRVTLAGTSRTVVVTITDRIPAGRRRIVDLSVAAARQLGIIDRGIAEVSLLPV
jgi:rare lipoprotein A